MTYPTVPEAIDNPINENLKKLEQLFPGVIKDGELDIEALREELGEFREIQPGDEKYELSWAGKQAAKKKAFEQLKGRTLKYVKDESKDPATTGNIYIDGDNFEALKLLRKNYYGAIKMIYIDPPYNTGNDFVYKDNFKVDMRVSEISEGVRTESGERLCKNEKSSNRFHANWLDMIYPRLKVAKDLLREDGVIFISIDDNEVDNLKKVCNEVYGSENFIETLIWKKRATPPNDRNIGRIHEFICAYAKDTESLQLGLIERDKKSKSRYSNPDNDSRGSWVASDLSANGKGGRLV